MIDQLAVKDQEGVQKKKWKHDQKAIKLAKEDEANEKKNQELKERMNRVYQREGKVAMQKSKKPEVKKEVKVFKIDQDTLDRLKYLGEPIPEEMQQQAKH